MAAIEKKLLVLATDLAKIDGASYIPTALFYGNNRIYFGNEAIKLIEENAIVNTNFKVDLGDYNHESTSNGDKIFDANNGTEKTAFELASDFFNLILKNVEGHDFLQEDEKNGLKIMVAEPLAFQIEEKKSSWIKYYRANIRRILGHYENVAFLPEPFAVYQYYRYGLKVPQLEEKTKHIVLIIDFGGGTFDVSIIESTHKGDVSMSQKHSKPLAASSEPIGGFFINEKIAEFILKRSSQNSTNIKKIDQFVRMYHRSAKNEVEFDKLKIEKKNFINNFNVLIQKIENKKIELCKKVANWNLGADCSEKVNLAIPGDVFSEKTVWKEVPFYAHELREIFKDEVWSKRIKAALKSAFERVREPLRGRKITATLISGGSSNIRWLERLITEEFSDDLAHAKPISLSGSFQEIVAKGLAIECARRFYNSDSEFVSVTYNPLRLLLNPDGQGIEEKKFTPIDKKFHMNEEAEVEPFVLLPSAAALQNFIHIPLQWKVKLSKPPRRFLEYHFMRPSEKPLHKQPIDYKNLYNVNNIVHTSSGAKFEGKIRVELTVKEDGTTYPKFIYTVGNETAGIKECSEAGQPFVIDMTTEHKKSPSKKYIGFDFGTSNTSLSLLTNDQLEIIEGRCSDPSWFEIKDLVHKLPYPISFSLSNYLSTTNLDNLVDNAKVAFDAMLSFIAYVASSELLAICESKPTIMRSFQNRSVIPLKTLIQNSLSQSLPNQTAIFVPVIKTLLDKHAKELEIAIYEFNEYENNNMSTDRMNVRGHLILLGNICNEFLQDRIFGYFDQIYPEKFRKGQLKGSFIGAYDSQPFSDKYIYKGKQIFEISEPILYDKKTKKALSLFPFLFWEEDMSVGGNLKCYILNKFDDNTISYIRINDNTLNEINDGYEELRQQVLELYQNPDFKTEYFDIELSCQEEKALNSSMFTENNNEFSVGHEKDKQTAFQR